MRLAITTSVYGSSTRDARPALVRRLMTTLPADQVEALQCLVDEVERVLMLGHSPQMLLATFAHPSRHRGQSRDEGRAPKSCLYVHFDEVRSRRAHDARNPNFNRARRTSDCRSRVVALPLMGRWSCCDAQSLTGSIL